MTNEGSTAGPHMLLYHVNLGWPLLDDGAVVDIPHASVRPRDADADEGFGHQYDIGAPRPRLPRAGLHPRGRSGPLRLGDQQATGAPLHAAVSETLPAVFEWKMTATQHYVLGLEPANTTEIGGRAAARAAGVYPRLEPGRPSATG